MMTTSEVNFKHEEKLEELHNKFRIYQWRFCPWCGENISNRRRGGDRREWSKYTDVQLKELRAVLIGRFIRYRISCELGCREKWYERRHRVERRKTDQ